MKIFGDITRCSGDHKLVVVIIQNFKNMKFYVDVVCVYSDEKILDKDNDVCVGGSIKRSCLVL